MKVAVSRAVHLFQVSIWRGYTVVSIHQGTCPLLFWTLSWILLHPTRVRSVSTVGECCKVRLTIFQPYLSLRRLECLTMWIFVIREKAAHSGETSPFFYW